MLAPIPFDAPVTTATFPSSFLLMSSAPPLDSAPCPFRRRACHDGCRAHGHGTAVRPDDGGRVLCPIGRQLRAEARPAGLTRRTPADATSIAYPTSRRSPSQPGVKVCECSTSPAVLFLARKALSASYEITIGGGTSGKTRPSGRRN